MAIVLAALLRLDAQDEGVQLPGHSKSRIVTTTQGPDYHINWSAMTPPTPTNAAGVPATSCWPTTFWGFWGRPALDSPLFTWIARFEAGHLTCTM